LKTFFAALGWVVIGVFVWIKLADDSEPDPAAEATKAAEQAEHKRKGFHCLEGDGTHFEVIKAVKKQMRDPDSFEHVETRVVPVNEKGQHTLTMKYRAKNGFGGMTIGSALSTFTNSDCAATVLSVE
jgi:hypothetical protein